ncbi:hypothetical protein TNCV_4757861 [Trichonephila clavipes]|nr:hypothetical protein TNCV_4757861 [Trichonephila clavipes]
MDQAREEPDDIIHIYHDSEGLPWFWSEPFKPGTRERVVRVQYFVRGGFVGHRSRVSSKHLSCLILRSTVFDSSGVKKGLRCSCKDARVGVGSTKDFDRCWEWLRYNG